MMNIAVLAYKHRPLVLMVTLMAMVFGGFSYFTLPAQEDPSITIREAIVSTPAPGMVAERVELLITKPLEEALLRVAGIEEIRSTSSDGKSIIHVKAYNAEKKLDRIWDEVEETVSEAASTLPSQAGASRVNDSFGDVAVFTLALTGDDFSRAELFDYAQYVRDQLITIPKTRKVEILGVQQERIYIEMENARLAKAGLVPGDIVAALQAQNAILPSGVIDSGDRAFSIVTSGEFDSVQDMQDLLIRLPTDQSFLRLGELVTVDHGYEDPAPTSAFFNGKQALVLSVVMRPGQSALNYSSLAKEVVSRIQQELPVGLNLSVITWQADQVENAIYGVSTSVLQTLAIVLGVVILFLGRRTGVIVGSIVPAVVLATLAIMSIFDMTLERMSLATIVIALGLLVDNGVVIAEDFKRRLAEHGDRDRALAETGSELAIPLLSSSLTTILVFTPLMLAQHQAGEYTRNISLIVLITLSVSWVLAMSVTPTLCHVFMEDPKPESDTSDDTSCTSWVSFDRIEHLYGLLLRKILGVRWLFTIAMFLLLPVGAVLVAATPKKFFPDSDRSQILVYVNLPAGVTTRTTEDRLQDMMKLLKDRERYPDLGDAVAYVGFGGPRFVLSLAPLDPAPHVGFMVINAADRQAVTRAIPRLRDDFRQHLTDVEARVSAMFLGPSDPNVIQIQVKGPDAVYIQEQSKKIEQMLADIPGTIDIWSNWYNRVTRLDVQVDQQQAIAAGVTSKEIAKSLTSYFSGSTVASFRDGDDVYPVVSRAIDAERNSLSRLDSIAIFSPVLKDSIPLSQVSDISPVSGFAHIQREDLVRTVTIEARNLLISPEDMAPMLQLRIDEMNVALKPGYIVEFDGIVKDSDIGKKALFAGFPICVMLAVLLLVAQFNGYARPLIVLLTIPLIVIGVGIGLQAMQAEFGFLVILGFFSLSGIIVNNAIVLIERIEIERNSGKYHDVDAIVFACVRRLRPIFITTITTIVGLLPLIAGRDVLFYGMASIMAFGLAIGTVLTLGVVPALYSIFFRIHREKH